MLDQKRLGKQRVETLQIARALTNPEYGWQTHPAVQMWRGHLHALVLYQNAICSRWTGMGFKDTCWEKTLDVWVEAGGDRENWTHRIPDSAPGHMVWPTWWGDYEVHASHRSMLLEKDPEFYEKMFTGDNEVMAGGGYIWPTCECVQCTKRRGVLTIAKVLGVPATLTGVGIRSGEYTLEAMPVPVSGSGSGSGSGSRR